MRFKLKPRPKLGDKRILREFLIFPARIGDVLVWLGSVYHHQTYINGYFPKFMETWVTTKTSLEPDTQWLKGE